MTTMSTAYWEMTVRSSFEGKSYSSFHRAPPSNPGRLWDELRDGDVVVSVKFHPAAPVGPCNCSAELYEED